MDLAVPDHSTLSRRARTLHVPLRRRLGTGPLHLLVDSTGVKLGGAGEWLVEKHGASRRRSWRKLHIGVDGDSGEILACELTGKKAGDSSQVGTLLDQVAGDIASVTADGAYDGEPLYRAVADRAPEVAVIIPPRATAKLSAQANHAPTQRDRHIQMIKYRGRHGWQWATGYGRRALVETTMFRYKTLIGQHLRARSLSGQIAEARTGCAVMNRMTHLGMPVSCRLA